MASWLSNRPAGIALEMNLHNANKATHSEFKTTSPCGQWYVRSLANDQLAIKYLTDYQIGQQV